MGSCALYHSMVLPTPSTPVSPWSPQSHSPLLPPPIWLSGRPAYSTLSTQTRSHLTPDPLLHSLCVQAGGQRGGEETQALPGSWAGVREKEVLGQGPASPGWAGRSGRCGRTLEPQVQWEEGRAFCMEADASVLGSQSPSPLPRSAGAQEGGV